MEKINAIRRLDELGRVVIPKEIRKSLRLRTGDSLEISSAIDGLLIKKYSPVTEKNVFLSIIGKKLSTTLSKTVIICDEDKILFSSDSNFAIGKEISKNLFDVLSNGKKVVLKCDESNEFVPVISDGQNDYDHLIIAPVYGDKVVGAIIVTSKTEFDEREILFTSFVSDITSDYLK